MVATVTPLTSATCTVRYFEQEGYYARDDPEHRKASRWHGRGAAELRLAHHVESDGFAAVLSGEVPGTDTVLGRPTRDGRREHRPGVDVTLQAPKSVSLAALVAGDARVVGAHDDAAAATLDFIEENLLVTRIWDRGTRRSIRVNAPFMAAATFRHTANRNLEPHLHTHAVVANMTRKANGRWGSLDMGPLRPAQKLIGAHYRNALASQLRELGYVLRPSMVGPVPGFEIEGYGRSLLVEHSSRRREIMGWVESRGLANTAANRQRAAYATRRRKNEPHHRELEARWRAQAPAIGLDRDPPCLAAGRLQEVEDARRQLGILEIVDASAKHLTERSSVFREADLCMLSLARSSGVYSHAEYIVARDQLRADGHLVDAVRRGLGPCLVTSGALRAEREIAAMMDRSRDSGRPFAGGDRVGSALEKRALTEGQSRAVRAILIGDSATIGVVVNAGTGKTAMLRALTELSDDHRVFALAPSVAAVQGLRAEAGLAARSLTGFLSRHRDVSDDIADETTLASWRDGFDTSVLILDDASMTSTAQMLALMRIVRRFGVGRLVLLGDTRQLRVAAAGQPFRQLQQAGMPTTEMVDVPRLRTPHPREAAVREIVDKPALSVGGRGALVHDVAFDELGRMAGQLWLALDVAGRDATVILAPTHETRSEINETVRAGLAAEGVLRGRELEIQRLIPLGLTEAQTRDIRNWQEGDAVVFQRGLREGPAKADECFTILAIDGGEAVLDHADGRVVRIDPADRSLHKPFELFETAAIRIRAGDVIRWTRDDSRRGLVDGQNARVLRIGSKGVRLATPDGRKRRLARDDSQLRHIDHVYSAPVPEAEGILADQVIAILDSGHGSLADQAVFCEAVSRTRDEVVVLTDNRIQLGEALEEQTGLRLSALDRPREWTGDRETDPSHFARIPDKPPILAAVRAFEALREAAEAAGCSLINRPEFRDAAARLERERGLPGLPADYRQRLDVHVAWISREIARRDAVASYRARSLREMTALNRGVDPVESFEPLRDAAEELVREGTTILDTPEFSPHLDSEPGLRSQVGSDLTRLRRALGRHSADMVLRDWQALGIRAEANGTIPCCVEGYGAVIGRIEALATDPFVPEGSAGAIKRILDGQREQRHRAQRVGDFMQRIERSGTRRGVLFADDGPGQAPLPQRRSKYAGWREDAERLHADGKRMLEDRSAWEPHLRTAHGWSLETLRSRLAQQIDMFCRDDTVLDWTRRHPDFDCTGRVADARHSIRCAGDLVLGDRVRWGVGRDGESAVQEGQITAVRRGVTDAGDRYEIQEEPLTNPPGGRPRAVYALDLFLGDVHRRPWSEESLRDGMRAEAAGPYSIACTVQDDWWVGAPDKPGEARVVPGDQILWVETVPGAGPDGKVGVRAIAANVVTVDAGPTPKRDRIRLRVLDSRGTNALREGSELAIEPQRLRQAGRFHRVAWGDENERKAELKELERQTAEIGRDRGPEREFGLSM
ncbi:MAG: relaxase domain-containing protein [Paracoccaceae bacterium]|nr:relaxase domain-containing protein [Paracoccaceae bacterium]